MAEKLGARAVLVFEETIDIPANEVPIAFRTLDREHTDDCPGRTNG